MQTIRDLIGGPGLWASSELFFNLKDNHVFPKNLLAFDTLCRASMIRAVVQSVTNWKEMDNGLSIQNRGLDDLIIFPDKKWWDSLAIVNIKKTFEECDSVSFDLHSPNLQSRLYSQLLPIMHPFRFEHLLRGKLSRWFSGDGLDQVADQAIKVLNKIHRIAPPCVLFCLMATWCNAWCTARRFQSQESICHLCRECNGDDSLEHYAICEAQWEIATSRLQLHRGAFLFSVFWD